MSVEEGSGSFQNLLCQIFEINFCVLNSKHFICHAARWTFLSWMLRDCGENYIIFGSHIGKGDNKQQLHYTGLLCKMKREK